MIDLNKEIELYSIAHSLNSLSLQADQRLNPEKYPPLQFIGKGEVKGFKFSYLIGNPQTFVYEVESYGSKHFEVFKAKWGAKFGKYKYPSSKSFGKWAWSFSSLEKALIKFNQLSISHE